ncbi:MAG: hypothetical protein LBG80_15815 [Bacteroidales bacterium]|jgi:hypothetical protein|nr:hypothetical protein [Bacteroidales bacterium]
MKRKSILMTIVAVLFAGVAWGQVVPPAFPGSHLSGVEGSDTIFFCYRTDSLYPLELGYDVAGKSLSPNYGKWTLYTHTEGAYASDYSIDPAVKNEGAGNAFKLVKSSEGGFVFQYEAEDELCGLESGKKFWTYVFVLPDYQDGVEKDTIVCVTTTPGTYAGTLEAAFKKYIDIYEAANFTWKWKRSSSQNSAYSVKTDSVAKYTFTDTIVLTPPATAGTDYTCGNEVPVVLRVSVDTIGQLASLKIGICAVDTLPSNMRDKDPNIVFKRIVPGTYSPATIGSQGWTSKIVKNKAGSDITIYEKEFIYEYEDCKVGTKYVHDTLTLMASYGYWDKDTVSLCRDSASYSVFTLYNDAQVDYPNVPEGKPGLTQSNSYWYDNGNGLTGSNFSYGTITPPGGASLAPGGYRINASILKSNIGYHYLWRPDPGAFECLINPVTQDIDSGTVVFILRDPAYAQDYTAQLCQTGYGKFDLNAYTLQSVEWDNLATHKGLEANKYIVAVGDSIKYPGTYKYGYSLPANCGPGGKGVFYLKVTEHVKAPKSKTVVFCYKRLPGGINANDILGVAVSGLTWTASYTPYQGTATTLGASDGFDVNTGILNITTFNRGSAGDVIEFTTDAGEDCGVPNDTKVTVKLVDDILN